MHFTLLDLFDKCFSTPNAKFGICPVAYMGGTQVFCLTPLLASVEFAQESICGWSHSADRAALTTRAGILSVSPCQTSLLDHVGRYASFPDVFTLT